MQLIINGNTRIFEQEAVSVSALLQAERILETQGLAVAVNQEVVPRSEWAGVYLKDNDQVLIIRAVQGG